MVPTETRYWDSTLTFKGYTLFGTRGTSYLIDFEGHVIHTWNIGTNPKFTEGGTLLDAVGGNPSNSNTWKELDWNGNIVWQYTDSRTNYHGHHDFAKIYNPKLGDSTFIYIANKDLTSQQCLDAGCDAANNYTGAQMDAIVEVNMQGNIIWEWCFFDHVVQDLYPAKPTYGVIANLFIRRIFTILIFFILFYCFFPQSDLLIKPTNRIIFRIWSRFPCVTITGRIYIICKSRC